MSETGATKQGLIAVEIFKERDRQTEKWGVQKHNIPEWMAILSEEVGEVAKEAVDFHFQHKDARTTLTNFRKELIQVMAVSMQIIEDIDDRYNWKEEK